MTEEEKNELAAHGSKYGVWCALTFAIPIGVVAVQRTTLTMVIAGTLIIIHIIGIPIWRKKQKKILYSTQWAKSKGYKI